MKKISRRAIFALVIALVLALGTSFFSVDYLINGKNWASHKANAYAYTDGAINRGTVTDKNGVILFDANPDWIAYNDDYSIRVSTLHSVGDINGNISSGVINNYSDKLIDYSFLWGLTKKSKGELNLTLDANICANAYNYLNGKNGAVGVYNYKTGDMLCMVSSQSYDPNYEPSEDANGVFVNRLLSGEYTPGSIMKIVTAFAAIENIDDIYDQMFICEGSMELGDDTIVCEGYHGEINFEDALAYSCNCAFAQISSQLDNNTMQEYAKKAGLLNSIEVNGVQTSVGSFDLSFATDSDKAWAGIGQYNDIINPCNFMVFIGAIANDGIAVYPTYVQGESVNSKRIMSEETANHLKKMLIYNVSENYGEDMFCGISAGAKSGSAEVGTDFTNAMFTGFIDDNRFPYAFIVVSENSGSGFGVAGNIASNIVYDIIN